MPEISYFYMSFREILGKNYDQGKFGKVWWLERNSAVLKPTLRAVRNISYNKQNGKKEYRGKENYYDNSGFP